MSDDWNFHDALEDGIRDNAGHLALAGALMAHSQRKQQLQSLEAARLHQAQIASTEAERLEIEKQRLELELLRIQEEKDRHEAVRLLRVMMAEAGGEFEGLAARGQLKGAPQGLRRDYAMAVLMSKLALVRSRIGSLSDLNDLKELSRLENLVEDLVIKHFSAHNPLEATRDKWRELQAWMNGVDRLEKEVKQACGVVPDPTAVLLPAVEELETRQRKLEEFAAVLSAQLKEHVSRLPADAAAHGVLLPELADQAQLEDLAAGGQANRVNAFASCWRQLNAGLSESVNSSLAKLQQWQDKHAEHAQAVECLAKQLEEGHLSESEAIVKSLGMVRFAGLNYQAILDLEALQNACSALAVAKRGAVAKKVDELRNQYPAAAPQSEFGQLLQRHQTRASSEKTRILVLVLVLVGMAAGFTMIIAYRYLEGLRLAAEYKAKIESERAAIQNELQSSSVGSLLELSLSLKVRQSFCFVTSGSFTMGSPENEGWRASDEGQVEVTFSNPFWLAKTEVTQAQWEAVMGSNPSNFKGANLPVENVSWGDAQSFITKLNETQILPAGWKFALPTEAQWEYACRAGEKGAYSGGTLDEVGWYFGNSDGKTHEAGLKKPNAWGLYDMHGNVWEWCADWYEDTLRGGMDPKGPSSGDYRVLRGGSWGDGASLCRAAYRVRYDPGNQGVRPAIVPSR